MDSDYHQINHKLIDLYKSSCEICGSYPERRYAQQFGKGELILDVSKLNKETIEVLCHAISQPVTPFIIIVSCSRTTSKRSTDENRYLHKILKALTLGLRVSRTLTVLKFELSLSAKLISNLCQGLRRATHLSVLRFQTCRLSRFCLEEICHALKNVTCLVTLGFNECHIDTKGVQVICSLLAHQNLNRVSTLWQDTLRSQYADLGKRRGLRHIELNDNPYIGDEGVRDLAQVLSDDIWITGLEMRNCGITNHSIEVINRVVKVNQVLDLVALDKNPFLNSDFVANLDEILRLRNPLRKSSVEREIVTRRTHSDENKKKKQDSSKSGLDLPSRFKDIKPGIPWRVEGRIIERKAGLPVGTLSFIVKEIDRSRVKVKKKTRKGAVNQGVNLRNIRNVIFYYKSKLKSEIKRRLKVEKRSKKLEQKLKHYEDIMDQNYILDEKTFLHVEQCFAMFQNLLMKLKQAGYELQSDGNDEEVSQTYLQSAIKTFVKKQNRNELFGNRKAKKRQKTPSTNSSEYMTVSSDQSGEAESVSIPVYRQEWSKSEDVSTESATSQNSDGRHTKSYNTDSESLSRERIRSKKSPDIVKERKKSGRTNKTIKSTESTRRNSEGSNTLSNISENERITPEYVNIVSLGELLENVSVKDIEQTPKPCDLVSHSPVTEESIRSNLTEKVSESGPKEGSVKLSKLHCKSPDESEDAELYLEYIDRKNATESNHGMFELGSSVSSGVTSSENHSKEESNYNEEMNAESNSLSNSSDKFKNYQIQSFSSVDNENSAATDDEKIKYKASSNPESKHSNLIISEDGDIDSIEEIVVNSNIDGGTSSGSDAIKSEKYLNGNSKTEINLNGNISKNLHVNTNKLRRTSKVAENGSSSEDF